MMSELRIGDVVAVTARVKAVRGDGGLWLEPLGFDFEVDASDVALAEGASFGDAEAATAVTFYTVDEPTLVRRGLVRGDERWASDGERYVYHKDLGEGLHLLNRPGAKQHTTGAWQVMTTGEVGSMWEHDPTEHARRE